FRLGVAAPVGPFARGGATAEGIAATSSRLEKGAILARYLAALADGALAVAARFFAGTVFPRHDARTVQVGPALLSRALAAVAGVEVSSLGERWVAHGDAGDLAADLLASRTDTGLALDDVAARLRPPRPTPRPPQRPPPPEALPAVPRAPP